MHVKLETKEKEFINGVLTKESDALKSNIVQHYNYFNLITKFISGTSKHQKVDLDMESITLMLHIFKSLSAQATGEPREQSLEFVTKLERVLKVENEKILALAKDVETPNQAKGKMPIAPPIPDLKIIRGEVPIN